MSQNNTELLISGVRVTQCVLGAAVWMAGWLAGCQPASIWHIMITRAALAAVTATLAVATPPSPRLPPIETHTAVVYGFGETTTEVLAAAEIAPPPGHDRGGRRKFRRGKLGRWGARAWWG